MFVQAIMQGHSEPCPVYRPTHMQTCWSRLSACACIIASSSFTGASKSYSFPYSLLRKGTVTSTGNTQTCVRLARNHPSAYGLQDLGVQSSDALVSPPLPCQAVPMQESQQWPHMVNMVNIVGTRCTHNFKNLG